MNLIDQKLNDINTFREDTEKTNLEIIKLTEKILSLDHYLSSEPFWSDIAKTLFIILSFNYFMKSTKTATEYMLESLSDTNNLSRQIGYYLLFYFDNDLKLPFPVMELKGRNLEEGAKALKKCIEKSAHIQYHHNIVAAATTLTEEADAKEHAKQIAFPSFTNFKSTITDRTPLNIVESATNGQGLFYSIATDGALGDDNFESKIKLNAEITIKNLQQTNPNNTDKNFFYLKDYSTDFGTFKIYIHDIIDSRGGQLSYARQLIAYFIDQKYNDFYRVTVGAGPFAYPSQMITVGELSNPVDQITKTLDNMLISLLSGIKYKK